MGDGEGKDRPFQIEIVDDLSGSSRTRYALAKLSQAVWKLATGTEGIKARLADAYIEIAILQGSDFPPALVQAWKRIKSDLTSGKMQFETTIVEGELVEKPVGLLFSTLRHMRKAKAADIARRICKLETELESYLAAHDSQAA
jgi:hypothetical protein